MALALTTIADSVSKLTVTGLTIKDVDEIPQTMTDRDCPVLIPEPDRFVANFRVVPDTLDMGKATATYTLNYRMIYAQVGTGRNTVMENYSGMVGLAMDFFDAILSATALTGAVDWWANTINDFGVVTIGSNTFHSCTLSIDIQEFIG